MYSKQNLRIRIVLCFNVKMSLPLHTLLGLRLPANEDCGRRLSIRRYKCWAGSAHPTCSTLKFLPFTKSKLFWLGFFIFDVRVSLRSYLLIRDTSTCGV